MIQKTGFGLILLVSSLFSQALELSLPDKNLQACVNEAAQKNNWQSINDITRIECHSKNIASLEGIEKFTGLQKLSLYNNQLTQVSLGHLPDLKHINLAKNKITQVSFSELTALEELYIFGNQLTEFQLINLPKLKLLKFNDNQIKTFTYKDLPAVEKIYMFNNLVEHLDIYHLPKMHYMDARQNPMPDPLYEEMDKLKGVTFLHDGNAEDWQ